MAKMDSVKIDMDVPEGFIDKYIGKDAFVSALYWQLQRDDVVVSNEDDPDKAAEQFSKNVTGGHIHQDLICGFIAGAKWLKDQAWGRVMLEDWYINSIANDTPPVWTQEHIDVLCKDFYLIKKEEEYGKK